MQLSKYFTLEEFIFSQTAIRHNIDNSPGRGILSALINTAENMDLVRELLNNPIRVSSGFRCKELNTKVGSKDNSQHIKGQAVDFTCPRFGTPESIVRCIKNSNIIYDQLILEFNSWVHISFCEKNRKQALIIDNNGSRIFA